jgi:hypothetical protein
MSDSPNPPLTPGSGTRSETVRVRRAPKFSVFLIVGAALGLLTALVLTFAFNGSAAESQNTGLVYSPGQVFGFLALICVTAGVAVFAVLALVLDRMSRARTREVRVDRETVQGADAD